MVPLESSPEVFTKFARQLGLSNEVEFHDIYSLTETELLGLLPRPIKALILLFPLNDYFESLRFDSNIDNDASVIWFKQTVRNTCGMYAIFHSLANNQEILNENSKLKKFLLENKRDNGRYEDESTVKFVCSVSEIYNSNSKLGQTEPPDAESIVDLHFVTFVENEGKIYELDGRRNGPHLLGKMCNGDLVDQILVRERVQWYMENAEEKKMNQFSLIGLGPSLE